MRQPNRQKTLHTGCARLSAVCAIAASVLLAAILASAQTFHVKEVLSAAARTLRNKTSVPLRLPTTIAGLENEPDLHAVINSVDDTGYIVVLAATPDCEGQHVCSYGALIGTTRPLADIDFYGLSDRHRVSVVLRNGVKASFYDTVCGAYCSDSLIVWTEGKYHYIIGLKADNKTNLIRAANSAIEAAERRK